MRLARRLVRALAGPMDARTRVLVGTAAVLAVTDIGVRVWQVDQLRQMGISSSMTRTGDVVTAREFRLMDDNGNARITMRVDRSGEPAIELRDRNGAIRALLDTQENTPSLMLLDQDGNRRAYYGMSSPTGEGELTFMSPNGGNVASLKIDNGVGDFSLLDENGVVRMSGGHVNIAAPFRNTVDPTVSLDCRD